ncbi:TPA: glycosyltransferase [Photobacterium damselae]
MKVMQIVPKLSIGGLQNVAVTLANKLMDRGVQVVLVSLSDFEPNGLVETINKNIKIVNLNVDNSKKIDFTVFIRLFKLMKSEKITVCHTHGISLFYSILPVFFSNIKFCHTIHNEADKDGGKIRRFIQGFLFKYFSVSVVTLSVTNDEKFKSIYGFNSDAIIENAIEPMSLTNEYPEVMDFFDNLENKISFVNIGRFSEQKNQIMLVNAFKLLIDKGYKANLVILGTDLNSMIYHELIKSINGYPIYVFTNKTNVSDYLKCSSAFILSSLYEGLPITILESLSMGTPIIATNVGGIPDMIIDENVGSLIYKIDIVSICGAMMDFIDNHDFSSTYIENHFKNKYSSDVFASKYLDVYINK